MHMPEMDGIALARQIRERHATLPLVLFSSLGRREVGIDERLFDSYLAKPIRQSQLFDTLVGLLARDAATKVEAAPGKPQLDPGQAMRHPLRILLAEDSVVNRNSRCGCCSKWATAPTLHRTASGRQSCSGRRRRADGRADAGDGQARSLAPDQCEDDRNARPRIVAMTAMRCRAIAKCVSPRAWTTT
jgi:hypothetical protein